MNSWEQAAGQTAHDQALRRIDALLEDKQASFDTDSVIRDSALLTNAEYELRRTPIRKRIGFDRVEALDTGRNHIRSRSKGEDLLLSKTGDILAVVANAITKLHESPGWKDVLAFNELTLCAVKLKPVPWVSPLGNWTDYDDVKLVEWFEHNGILIDSADKVSNAMQAVAHEHFFHPVRDYLNGLKWDGTQRLESWLPTYIGAKDNEYTRAVGKRWLISAVARMFQPGCQADYLLVLEGMQGILKSSALRALFGDEFFADNMGELDNKDSLLGVHSVWLMELSELASTKRTDSEKAKSFLSRRVDYFRPPYGRKIAPHPRTNVFAGTSNDETPFVDETGNRRYWPVKCGKIDIEKIKKDRDQIWAEVVTCYKKGDPWWLETRELNKLATEQQAERYQHGQWDDLIEAWLEKPTQRCKEGKTIEPFDSDHDSVTIADILTHCIAKPQEYWTQADRNSISRCLKHNGWKHGTIRRGKRAIWGYKRRAPEKLDIKGAGSLRGVAQPPFPHSGIGEHESLGEQPIA